MCLSYADAGFLALPFAIKESLASISTIAAAHFFSTGIGPRRCRQDALSRRPRSCAVNRDVNYIRVCACASALTEYITHIDS